MIIMHVDANSAFLSWTTADSLKHGGTIDYRKIPAVIGGEQDSRRGIVLAKSDLAKKCGIQTADSLYSAKKKCPGLAIIPPDFDVYRKYSNAMYRILSEYTPIIERYSIDECFLDYTASEKLFGDPEKVAYEIKDRIKNELGFTVNVGVSVNKVLAKMGSELQKPDRVHTLWPDEIEEKMWPLPVEDLFMCGKSSAASLKSVGIYTIGDLAKADDALLQKLLKSHGPFLKNYANGIDYDEVSTGEDWIQKGVGHDITIDHNVTDQEEAKRYLLRICETVCTRLRGIKAKASVVAVTIRTKDMIDYGHQMQIGKYINSATELYEYACALFDESWHQEPIRQLGVRTTDLLYDGDDVQLSLFDTKNDEQEQKTDETVDKIRERFGFNALTRASLIENDNKAQKNKIDK